MSIFYTLLAETSLSLDQVAASIAGHLGVRRDGLDINTPTVRVTVTASLRYDCLYAAEQRTPTVSAGFYPVKRDLLNGSYDTLAAAAHTMVDCATAADLAYNGDELVLRWGDGVLTLYRWTEYWDHPGVLERIPQPYVFSDEHIIL